MNINYDSNVSEDSKRALSSLKIAVKNALKEKKIRGQYSVIWDKNSANPKQLNYVAESSEEYQA